MACTIAKLLLALFTLLNFITPTMAMTCVDRSGKEAPCTCTCPDEDSYLAPSTDDTEYFCNQVNPAKPEVRLGFTYGPVGFCPPALQKEIICPTALQAEIEQNCTVSNGGKDAVCPQELEERIRKECAPACFPVDEPMQREIRRHNACKTVYEGV